MANRFQEIGAFDTDSSRQYGIKRWCKGIATNETDNLAEEVPVALVYNGVSHAVMLATPQNLEDFAMGFSLTEGILQKKSELYEIETNVQAQGIELHLTVATERFVQLKEYRRSMAGRTGCGLCGAESLAQVFRLPEQAEKKMVQTAIKVESIFKAHQAIQSLQTLQKLTGATHACAWADVHGNIGYVREDVGRHNALDKLIGALLNHGITGGFIVTTSRASYEMVQKIVMAGFSTLVAISAPTGLAVRIANAYDITLLGFVRDQQYVVYSHADRIIE